jgi:coproporphyrinogen III oxidase-like Fe-S oxidoreductase
MINDKYNEKFNKFFSKFEKQYLLLKTEEEKEYLWKLAVDFVETNRDFVMQYPIVPYWEDLKKNDKNEYDAFLFEYNDKNINLYFHIPFCVTRCTYCNFHISI